MLTKAHWTRTTGLAVVCLALSGMGDALAQIRPPIGSPGGQAPQQQQAAPGGGGGLFPSAGNRAGGGGGGNQDFISQTEQDLQDQAAGRFPVIQRSSTLPIGAIQKKWNQPIKSSGQTAPGIMRYVWRPDFVMPIRTREFMTTTLELPSWENVERIILGDTLVFEATRVKPNLLVVRPSHSGADTNMTVIGASGNIYNFYLRSEGWNSDQITDFTVYISAGGGGSNIIEPAPVGAGDAAGGSATPPRAANSGGAVFRSGATSASSSPTAPAASSIQPPDYIREIAFKPEDLRFDLRLFAPTPADIEIAPLRAFTDGVWTYFDYGEKADTVRRPVVFLVVDGVDTMVNTRTAGPTGGILIAEAVGNFTLRNGNRVICVYEAPAVQTFRSGGAPVPESALPRTPRDSDEEGLGRISPGYNSQLQLGRASN